MLTSSLILNHTGQKETERHLICMTNTLLVSTQIQHFPVTSGNVRQRNPIKFYQYLPGAKIKPFMLSLQCVLDLCSWWKDLFSCVLFVSEVYPEGLEFVKTIKKYERKWDWTPHTKQLAPDTRNCMHVNMFVWPVTVGHMIRRCKICKDT